MFGKVPDFPILELKLKLTIALADLVEGIGINLFINSSNKLRKSYHRQWHHLMDRKEGWK